MSEADKKLIIHAELFLHIDFVIFQTGIFNMADVFIMAGVCMIILELYSKETKLNAKTVEKQ